MTVDQSWDDPAALQVDAFSRCAGGGLHISRTSDGEKAAIRDRHGFRARIAAIERAEASVIENKVCSHSMISEEGAIQIGASTFFDGWAPAVFPGSWPKMCGTHCSRTHAVETGWLEVRRLASGTTCSPTKMPNSPISAITGGAGE